MGAPEMKFTRYSIVKPPVDPGDHAVSCESFQAPDGAGVAAETCG
jgi:hypothetical protein